jgi:hypothetical protein
VKQWKRRSVTSSPPLPEFRPEWVTVPSGNALKRINAT